MLHTNCPRCGASSLIATTIGQQCIQCNWLVKQAATEAAGTAEPPSSGSLIALDSSVENLQMIREQGAREMATICWEEHNYGREVSESERRREIERSVTDWKVRYGWQAR